MIKPGDLVMLANDTWKVPGALSAVKYFHRLQEDYGNKVMVVLEVREKELIRGWKTAGVDRDIIVFVNSKKICLSSSLLRVVD
jgi:phosphoribosylformimino-5-aminoimidazole carboxamide ribonucleotide (ProFAR) isomerase